MTVHGVLVHLRNQWAGCLALFLVLGGGAAYAAAHVSSADIINGQVKKADLASGAVTGKKVARGAITSDKVLDGTLTGSDLAAHSVTLAHVDGTDHTGQLGVGGVASGRCTTVTVAMAGARAGDVGILTTNGTLPDGQVMYLQRVLDDTGQVKVCNLSGGDLPAVNVDVRIVTFH